MFRVVAGAVTTIILMSLGGQASANLDDVAVLIEAKRYQVALDRLQVEPVSRRSRLLQANALAALRRTQDAETLYLALIDEEPRDPSPINNLASLYASQGRLQEASELLTRAINIDERYAAIYKNLSRVYVEMSRNSYAKALRLGEQKQGLTLLTLDYTEAAPQPILVAEATKAARPVAPVKAVAEAAVETPKVEVAAASPARPQELQSMGEGAADQGPVDAGDAIAALKRWSRAWSAQDVGGYLAAYADDFLPPHELSLSEWQAQRRIRLLKPKKIEVLLSDFEVSSTGGSSVTVKLTQRYRSDSYRDTTRKGFILVLRNGEWKIGDEYTIEEINGW